MKKSYIIPVLAILLFLGITALLLAKIFFPVTILDGYDRYQEHAQLVINGEYLEDDEEIIIYQAGSWYLAYIPVLASLQSLGYPVIRTDADTAQVTIHGEEFMLSLSAGRTTETEVYMVSMDFQTAMKNLGIDIDMTIDPENRLVTITSTVR